MIYEKWSAHKMLVHRVVCGTVWIMGTFDFLAFFFSQDARANLYVLKWQWNANANYIRCQSETECFRFEICPIPWLQVIRSNRRQFINYYINISIGQMFVFNTNYKNQNSIPFLVYVDIENTTLCRCRSRFIHSISGKSYLYANSQFSQNRQSPQWKHFVC